MSYLAEMICLSTHIMDFDKKARGGGGGGAENFGIAVFSYLVLCIKAGNQPSGFQGLYFMVIVRLKPEIY